MNPYKKLVITSPFAKRINPITNQEEFHRGNDFRPICDHTFAGISGVVIKAEMGVHGEGLFVQVTGLINETVFFTNSFHNADILVKPGENVRFDQVVAISGSTGNSTAKHIHHEVFTYDVNNPFVLELKKTIKTFLVDTRLFFDPLPLYDFFEKNNIDY
jgi:murein DD-endopeptidase MepM/ murein hydrolase activator NlpD